MSSTHWDNAYATKGVEERSWSQNSPTESLSLIADIGLPTDAAIIDIGGGSSTLVDELLKQNFSELSVLDISESALDEVRHRISAQHLNVHNVHNVSWICADITAWQPHRTYKLWHDRAVFHFLTSPDDQRHYLEAVLAGTETGSHVIMATFAPTGPESCSGLPVSRWSVAELEKFFGDNFTLISGTEITHVTPWGSTQDFTWEHLLRR